MFLQKAYIWVFFYINKMKAIIAAAGSGGRMYPLSMYIPKVLAPIKKSDDTTLIDRLVNQIKEAGIEDIGIVVGYKKNVIKKHFKDRGININYFEQEERKGNADAVYQAKEWLEGDNILYVGGDNFLLENRIPGIIKHIEGKDGVIGVKHASVGSKHGVVKSKNGIATALVRKSKNTEQYKDASIMCFKPDFLEYLHLKKWYQEGRNTYEWEMPEAVNEYLKDHNVGIYDIGERRNVNTLGDLEKVVMLLEEKNRIDNASDVKNYNKKFFMQEKI